MIYTAEQLQEIPAAARCVVTLTTGEQASGLFDGAFIIDATQEITGMQIMDKPPWGVRYIEKDKVAQVEV
jgi:hypothetical protein